MIGGLTRAEETVLLGRPVESLLTSHDRGAFAGRRVLVTGAGGSVGAELARQLAECGPAHLTLLEQSEHALFCIEREIGDRAPGVRLTCLLADVTRPASVRDAIRRARPEIVFHAAAYKHVTMAERAVCAAARTNVIGTAELLTALRDTGARFVLISSDKAAAPRSVMGATKRLAELLTLGHAGRGVEPLVVRFGNVLASSGSFVALMLERIRDGRPLTLTDPGATRYFMALSEAASLVMKAATLGAGGDTLWLDMGDQIRMGDLAARLQTVGESRGWPRVPVDVIGLRPGEKRVEQLATDGVPDRPTADPRIRVARAAGTPSRGWELLLRTLRRRVALEDGVGVLAALSAAVADYEPSDYAWTQAGRPEGRRAVPAARTA